MFNKNLINCPSIFTILFSIVSITLICCNSAPAHSDVENQNKLQDTLSSVSKNKDSVPPIVIDSVKMHAFDDVYFGTTNEIVSKRFIINDIPFNVKSSQGSQKGLCYFMLQNVNEITTKQKALKVISDLKNTISVKYQNAKLLNKIFHVEHPEMMKKGEAFELKSLYKFDENTVGLPYEYKLYQWDLKYKKITIGYFIDYKNKKRMFQSTPRSDYYIIYIEFESKLIKPDKISLSNDSKKDSDKF